MYLDTRDLIEKREELKEKIFNNFLAYFPQYEDMTDSYDDILMDEEEIQDWKYVWLDEITEITEIDVLEDEVSSSEWDYGIIFISEDKFEDYCKELLEDIGDLPPNLPAYIEDNIDWAGVADDLRVDYSEVEYQGETYLFRA